MQEFVACLMSFALDPNTDLQADSGTVLIGGALSFAIIICFVFVCHLTVIRVATAIGVMMVITKAIAILAILAILAIIAIIAVVARIVILAMIIVV